MQHVLVELEFWWKGLRGGYLSPELVSLTPSWLTSAHQLPEWPSYAPNVQQEGCSTEVHVGVEGLGIPLQSVFRETAKFGRTVFMREDALKQAEYWHAQLEKATREQTERRQANRAKAEGTKIQNDIPK